MDHIKDVAGALASIVAVVAGLLGLLRYVDYQSKRDKVLQIRETFNAVVRSLSSEVEVERLAGAILLRRFFDEKSEVGTAGNPFAREALDVSAAILRGQSTGNFQKLLADGLGFARNLEWADLQRTNLQFAYLGDRTTPAGPVTAQLSHADFYRADLSKASLKKAVARGAVFYQARMQGTVLAGADLQDASFFEADVNGAKFDGALLARADFRGARNIPPALAEKLDKETGKYVGTEAFRPPAPAADATPLRVFVSKPGCVSAQQQQSVTSLLRMLDSEGMAPHTLERSDYPSFEAFAEVQRLIGDCAGAIIFGFKQLEVRDGVWRPGTPEEKHVQEQPLATPWNQIEAGMATMLALPLFVVYERGVSGGIFDTVSAEHQVYRALVEDDWNAAGFTRSFADWTADVRERRRVSATTG